MKLVKNMRTGATGEYVRDEGDTHVLVMIPRGLTRSPVLWLKADTVDV